MLDTETKRRIDTARDILVGKVPDPKSQVEQITIALIYKFMDDMDAEAEELGGKRKFFAGEFARYGWAKLMRSGLGGHDTLALYAEGITKMTENPGLPVLFRDIFKNAFLPYRDPETLKAFLKIIDEFTYDHSERLGDAFEYLLSVLGSQGDAGQFRTPRHIIDFVVSIVDPKKDETVLDPACGTAGFLISSFKHILRANTDAKGHSRLTPDDRTRLAKNFKGYDISPDMVRLSLVNLYLHGFTDPHIYEYDTLTSEERWNEFVDVILANPPFMSPKGGIKPHRRFSVQSKRSEVLFVDYMAEHLTPNGRAGIIVPEGIIFQSQGSYTELRRMLVENSLVAVISLPAGVFNPYSGVKTSILILDKALAKKAQTIAFFKVENDGFGLGAQRRPIDKDDLPQVQDEVAAYFEVLRSGKSTDELSFTSGLIVSKEELAANGDYNLSGERYREGAISNAAYPLVPVGRFMKEGVKTIDPRNTADEIFELWSIPAFDVGTPEMLRGGEIGSQKKAVFPGDVLLSRIIPHIRRGWVVRANSGGHRQIASTEWIVFSSEEIVPAFLRNILVSDPFHAAFMQTITGVGGSLSRANPGAVAEIQIPLPPLEVQKEIVAEIEGYQKVINGARAVLDHYRSHIPIHPDWPVVKLGEICGFKNGLNFTKGSSGYSVKIIGVSDFQTHLYAPLHDLDEVHLNEPLAEDYLVRTGDILFVRSNGNPDLVGRSLIVPSTDEEITFSGFTIRGRVHDARALPDFFAHFFKSRDFAEMIKTVGQGANIRNLSQSILNELKVPLPPLSAQQAIVREIEGEQALVAANRELITRFEKKIQAALARVWGEDAGAAEPIAPAAQHVFASTATSIYGADEDNESSLRVAESPIGDSSNGKSASKSIERPPASNGTARDTAPKPIADTGRDEVLAKIRENFSSGGPRDRETALREVSQALGYARLGANIREALDRDLLTAVRRGILHNEGGELSLLCRSIEQYGQDFLKDQFLAAISQSGRIWIDRDEATRAFARWLGFRRTGETISEKVASLINGLLRQNRLEADGPNIRRAARS